MNTQPPPEPNYETTNPEQVNETPPEILPEQLLNLKLETEQLYRNVDRLSRLLQTLVTGLLIATLVAIGIAGWFAYRLLLQESIARREVENTAATQREMLERLEQLEGKLQSQDEQVEVLSQQVEEIKQQMEGLNQQVPEQLRHLIQENQQQLGQLRDRLEQIETQKQVRSSPVE